MQVIHLWDDTCMMCLKSVITLGPEFSFRTLGSLFRLRYPYRYNALNRNSLQNIFERYKRLLVVSYQLSINRFQFER